MIFIGICCALNRQEIKTPFKMTYFEYPNISNIRTTLGPEVFGIIEGLL